MVWAEPSRQTHFGAVHSPKFANLLMFHHEHKTPNFYDSSEFIFCPYCNLLQCRVSADPFRQFFRMVHCILCPAPIELKSRLLLSPAVVQDISRQLGVRPCTTWCTFCCGIASRHHRVHYSKAWCHPQSRKYTAYFHVCCPF